MNDMRSFLKKSISIIMILTIVIGVIIGYNHELNKNIEKDIERQLVEVTSQLKSQIVLSNQYQMLLLIKVANGIIKESSAKQALNYVNDMKETTKFEDFYLLSVEGKGYSQDGTRVDASQTDFFNEALSGHFVVSEQFTSQDGNYKLVAFATPIVSDTEILGILVGTYSLSDLSRFIPPIFGGNGSIDIVLKDGSVIATNRGMDIKDYNIFDNPFGNSDEDYEVLNNIKSDFEKNESGFIPFSSDNMKKYSYYSPLGIEDYYILTTIEHYAIAANSVAMKRDSMLLSLIIFFCLGTIFFMFIKSNKSYSNHLYEAAFYDTLTGIPNIKKFTSDIDTILKDNPDKQFSCIMFDTKNFKYVNDAYGFEVGDRLIKSIAKACQEFIDKEPAGTSTIARLYSDTFAMFLLTEMTDSSQPPRKSFVDLISEEVNFIEDYTIDLKLGRYLVKENDNAEKIFERANLAHSRAQSLPVNTFIDFTDEQREDFNTEVSIRNKCTKAIKNNEFVVFLQPKIDLLNDTICGAEALVRWKQGDQILQPDKFIPILERNDMVKELDLYIFEECCKLLNVWKNDGRKLIPISVNFSRNHLWSNDLADKLHKIVCEHEVLPENLIIEFTETATMDNIDRISDIVEHLHEHGFLVSMDDFGSGYSSLGFMRNVFMDEIKLDRSFISGIDVDERSRVIVKNVVALSSDIGTSIVAEGVETVEQKNILKELNCFVAQGYLFSPPVPCEQIFSIEEYTPHQ